MALENLLLRIVSFTSGILPVIGSSLIILSIKPIKRRIDWVIRLFIISYANIIITTEILSLLKLISKEYLLLFHWVVFVVLIVFSYRRHLKITVPFDDSILRRTWHALIKNPLYFGLIVSLVIAYFLVAVDSFFTYDYNVDVQRYHLARIGFFVGNNSLIPETTHLSYDVIFSPMNAAIGYMWTILFWGSDQFANFVQLVSLFIVCVAIYGVALHFQVPRKKALLFSLIYPTIPTVYLLSASAKDDMIIAAFVMVAIYYFLLFVEFEKKLHGVMFFISLAMAVGTKLTVLYLLPGLGLFFVIVVLKYFRKKSYKFFIKWVLIGSFALILFGSYSYIQNLYVFGSPIGTTSLHANVVSEEIFIPKRVGYSVEQMVYCTVENSLRTFSNLFNTTPAASIIIPNLPFSLINKGIDSIFISINNMLNLKFDEMDICTRIAFQIDSSLYPYGIQFALFLFPLSLIGIFQYINKREWVMLGALLIFWEFLVAESALHAFSPAPTRYLILALPIYIVICADIFIKVKPKITKYLVPILLIYLSVATLFMAYIDIGRNLQGLYEARESLYVNNNYRFSNPPYEAKEFSYRDTYNLINQVVDDNTMALLSFASKPLYPRYLYLFGEDYSRRVVPLICEYGIELVGNILIQDDIDYLLVNPKDFDRCNQQLISNGGKDIKSYYRYIAEINSIALYQKTENKNELPFIESSWLSFPPEKEFAVISKKLAKKVKIVSYETMPQQLKSIQIPEIFSKKNYSQQYRFGSSKNKFSDPTVLYYKVGYIAKKSQKAKLVVKFNLNIGEQNKIPFVLRFKNATGKERDITLYAYNDPENNETEIQYEIFVRFTTGLNFVFIEPDSEKYDWITSVYVTTNLLPIE